MDLSAGRRRFRESLRRRRFSCARKTGERVACAGSDQRDQLMSLSEPAHYLTVASGNSQAESDPTGTFPLNYTPLAAKFPVDVSSLSAQTKPAKQEDHQISATRSKVRRFSQIKADNHRPTQIRSVGNNADQGSGLIPTPNFTSSAY